MAKYIYTLYIPAYIHCAQQSTPALQKGYERTGQTTFLFTLLFN
jgi:hypothetical protein